MARVPRLVVVAALAGLAVAGAVRALALVPVGAASRGLAGPLGSLGLALPSRFVALLMVGMTGCYVVVVAAGAAVPHLPAVGLAVAMLVLFALVPPLVHRDLFAYVAYGRMAARHLNPYTQGPGALGHDAVNGYYDPRFARVASKYGPLFTLLAAALTPLGVVGAAWALKILVAAAGLGLLAVLDRAARSASVDRTAAVVLVGLNPLWLAYAIGGGHNDVLMVLALTVAAVALIRGKEVLGAAAAVVAAAVKPSAVVAVPMLLLGARSRRRALAGAVVAAVVVGAVSAAFFGSPLALARTLEQHVADVGRHSLLGLSRRATGVNLLGHSGRYVLLAAFLTAYAAIGTLTWRRRLTGTQAGGWTMAALLCCSTIVYAWYIVWLLPLAALSRGRALRIAAVALTAVVTAMWPARGLLPF